jgi:Fur family ferric uptake transcriptional regulator
LQPGANTMSCVNTLKARGLKLTPQRRLIVDVIHEARGHLTAEEIIKDVQVKMPGVNKSTIYRTLELLENAGCVYKSELGNEFIYHHDEEGHHHHLVCSRCGKTVDCDENIFTQVQRSLKSKYNFSVDFRHMVMTGVCEKCRSRES